jgi:hypothetical protein
VRRLSRKLECVLSGVEVDGLDLAVRYAPVRGSPPEIVDRITLGPRGEVGVVEGVGRLLRLLRAGRVRAPADPYALYENPEHAEELVARCQGAKVRLEVKSRFDRVLSIWTESGVERIAGVLDFHEEVDVLAVRRKGGQTLLRIPRASLIRYEAASTEYLQVVSIDPTQSTRLP